MNVQSSILGPEDGMIAGTGAADGHRLFVANQRLNEQRLVVGVRGRDVLAVGGDCLEPIREVGGTDGTSSAVAVERELEEARAFAGSVAAEQDAPAVGE